MPARIVPGGPRCSPHFLPLTLNEKTGERTCERGCILTAPEMVKPVHVYQGVALHGPEPQMKVRQNADRTWAQPAPDVEVKPNPKRR